MFKRIILMVVCLLFASTATAQDNDPDCSSAAISEALNAAVLDAHAAIAEGVDPAVVLEILETALDELRANCTITPGAQSSGLGWDDYADLPQWRQADGGFVLGDPDAQFTLVEFLDYACPHCQFYSTVRDEFIEKWVRTGAANYEVRVFPTAGGQLTAFVGQVIACLEEQREGAFWEAQEILFDMAVNGKFNERTAETVTDKLALDYDEALECATLHTEAGDGQMQADLELASELGVQATPTVMLRVDGGVPQFITYEGTTYTSGGVPYEGIVAAIHGEIDGGEGGSPL